MRMRMRRMKGEIIMKNALLPLLTSLWSLCVVDVGVGSAGRLPEPYGQSQWQRLTTWCLSDLFPTGGGDSECCCCCCCGDGSVRAGWSGHAVVGSAHAYLSHSSTEMDASFHSTIDKSGQLNASLGRRRELHSSVQYCLPACLQDPPKWHFNLSHYLQLTAFLPVPL